MTAVPYAEFLAAKRGRVEQHGVPCDAAEIDPRLFGFQRDLTAWAARQGRAAIFADTGLGKTRMQLAWLDKMCRDGDTTVPGLILAPLAVAQQTIREAGRLDLDLVYVRDHDAVNDAVCDGKHLLISNYDRLHLFDPDAFCAVVLDESSILKDVTAKTRDQLIDAFADTPYRLACTATPAPNDVTELANHAEFLGAATRREMLSTYFVADLQRGYRVKGHAEDDMWSWVASWAMACRRPSDLGYSDDGYDLPPLRITPHLLPVNSIPDGELFATELGGVSGRARIRRETLAARIRWTAELVDAERHEPWLLWCGLNDEADALARAIPGAVNVHGGLSAEDKAAALLGFATDGDECIRGTARTTAAWGAYEPAIRRWERTLGRPAPAPTEPNTRGGRRLAPPFVEWLMGLPAGWVCDVPGLTRNDQLKMLGNGVVPQQAAAALEWLLAADVLHGAA